MRLNQINRAAQVWLMGDVGVPKVSPNVDKLPGITGYYTEITTKQPTPAGGWSANPFKQPACRHNLRAVFCCADGHVESWKWTDLRSNVTDVFAIYSY
jgi:hypothetical protein